MTAEESGPIAIITVSSLDLFQDKLSPEQSWARTDFPRRLGETKAIPPTLDCQFRRFV